jgi:aquaporin Z
MYKYFVEFLGTLLFISTFAFTGNPALILASLGVAMGLGGKISGGHFNPAISTWAWLSSKLSTADYGMYILMQSAAAGLVWILSEVSSGS